MIQHFFLRRLRLINSKDAVAILLLLLFTLVFFKEAVFEGKILSPIDAACPVDPVWNEACGHINVSQNSLIGSDQAAQFYPWRALVRRLLQEGTLPLWNPYNASGYPLLANAQSSVFYPINLLADLFPIKNSFTVSAVLRLFITSLGVFLLARHLKFSRAGALLSATSFAFSSPVIVWLGYAMIEVVTFFPLLLYFIEKMFISKKWGFTLAVGVTFGLMGLAGHPQTLLMSMVILGFYLAGRLAILRLIDHYAYASLGRIIGQFALASLLGLGWSAIQLLPTWHMLPASNGYIERVSSTTATWFASGINPQEALTLILYLWPHFFGNPAWPEVDTGNWIHLFNYNPMAVYLGFLPLVLLPFAFTPKQSRWIPWLYAGLALVSIGLFLRLPLFYAISEVGLMEKVLTTRFRIFAALALAMLAGRGLDGFLIFYRQRLYALLVLGLTLALSLTVGLAGFKLVNHPNPPVPIENFNIAGIFQAASQIDLPSWAALPRAPLVAFVIPLGMSAGLLALTIILRHRPAYLGLGLAALVAIDLYTINAGFNVTNEVDLEPAKLAQKSPTITYLRQTMQPTDRLVALGATLLPNSASLLGLSDVRGYDIMMPARYYRLFEASPGYHRYGPGGFFLTQLNPALRLLSVNYILTLLPLSDYQLVFQAPSGLLVYHVTNALPRAYLVYNCQVLPPETIFETIVKGAFDPAATALLEQPPPDWWQPTAVNTPPGMVNISDYKPNRVMLEVDAPAPALLVLTDGYDDGWQVRVDGQPQPVYRVNEVVRGVFIQAGAHRVEYVYAPLTFKIGAALTITAIVITCLAGFVLWRRSAHVKTVSHNA